MSTRRPGKKTAAEAGRRSPLPEERGLRDYVGVLERLNRGLRVYINEMSIVFRFIETVSGIREQDRILNLLMDVLKELCGYDAALLYLFQGSDPNRREEQVRAVHAEWAERYRRRLEIDDRIYQWVYRQGHAVIIPDQFSRRRDPEFRGWSFMVAPLHDGSNRLGRVELVFKRPQGTFTQQTFSILNVLLRHTALILANAEVFEKERRTVQKYIELDMLKQDVVNTTTHEIRTPLTIIQASSILLERNPRMLRRERNDLLANITFQCGRINQIVTELFETAQLEENRPLLHPEALSLREIMDEVQRSLLIDKQKHTLDLRLPQADVRVLADRSSLLKVLQNLVKNAINYSPKGGTIVIRARQANGRLVWSVTDPGVGISPEDQKKIFDKFFRANLSATRGVRGMGLGLYIVKRILDLNHGSISLKSQLGQGSTFTIRLPIAP